MTRYGCPGPGLLLCTAAVVVLAAAGGTETVRAQAIDGYQPVTDAVLQNPDPGDWLHWRRTLDAWGHSPLDEITADNAEQLRMIWSWALTEGSQQTTPMVYGGVMYIANPGERVQALDGASGELLWEYLRPRQPAEGGSNAAPPNLQHRNLAIYQDKILSEHVGRAHRGARRPHRRRGVGYQRRGGAGLRVHQRLDHRRRQGVLGADRLRALPR